MKKLLSFISTITIVGSAALTVVSCSGDESQAIVKLIERSKNSASVIYLGAKDNQSSRSFEYGLKQVLGVNSMDEASKQLSASFNVDPTGATELKADNELFLNWQTAFKQEWKNTDLSEANVNLDTKSKEYGKISDLKKDSKLFSKPKGATNFFFDYISYDKTEDLTKATTKLTDEYIRNDLMTQLASFEFSNKEAENARDALSKRTADIKKAVDDIKTNITKGPIFLVVKNGHIVSINNGWFTYVEPNLKNTPKGEPPADLLGQYKKFIESIGEIMGKDLNNNAFGEIFKKNSSNITNLIKVITNDVSKSLANGGWDQGAVNWDTKKDQPTNFPTKPDPEPNPPKPEPKPPGDGGTQPPAGDKPGTGEGGTTPKPDDKTTKNPKKINK
ncbi:hypothetical protein ELUMI_v1c04510 [Williamsoniiplasma luminosum]|uniref:Lipoprotein n=1 Tax=Williamsoniiplasma luminosum TaxID=214888 RepID=A0A2K8NTJ8_9MOLU|nr:lipoprotein [Williamsoniiplasma luminosum]ATZ17175.1 hypothetical protein ELUMI_v1c04510 [Williamsoniiplasma luminosum]